MFNFMRLPPLRRLMLMKAITGGGSWSTVTGNPVSFTAKAAPLRQLSVAFSPVQAGSGDPSPDNVRPISGWDSLNVYHSGADTSNPQTISISLGSTVYSGYVDVVTGVVTVDMEIVDLGAYGWTYYAGSGVFRNLSVKSAANSTGVCTQYKSVLPVTWETQPDMTIQSGTADTVVKDSRYTDATDFKAAMDGVMFVHKLVTPQTFQLTPQEVESLAGDNVLFSDANGDLTVTYRSN